MHMLSPSQPPMIKHVANSVFMAASQFGQPKVNAVYCQSRMIMQYQKVSALGTWTAVDCRG